MPFGFSGFYALGAGVVILLLHSIQSMHDLQELILDLGDGPTPIEAEKIGSDYTVVHAGDDFVLYHEDQKGTLEHIGTFDEKRDVYRYIGDIKVGIRGR